MTAKSQPHMAFARPEDAIDALQALYAEAVASLRAALDRYFDTGVPPSREERTRYRYPQLRVTYLPEGVQPTNRRAFAKFPTAGTYTSTVTQPEAFRAYLLEQLRPLMSEYHAKVEVGMGTQEIPYPYVFERGDELGRGTVTAAELARFFPVPLLASVGDEVADGLFQIEDGAPRPLALFDAVRVDYSLLRRLVHYTGTDWRDVQSWILLTNYHRYVDQFIRWGLEAVRSGSYERLLLPGSEAITAQTGEAEADAIIAHAPWHRYQMPAYHVTTPDRQGVTLVNIGVGPSNAKKHHRPSRRPAAALLADGRPLRRLAAIPAHRRLCPRSWLSAAGSDPGRAGADRHSDPGAGRGATSIAGGGGPRHRRPWRVVEAALCAPARW